MAALEVAERSGASGEWDAFVAACGGDTYSQSTAFAEVKQPGHRDHRVEVRRDGRLVAGMQILSRRVGRIGSIGYAAKGPLLAEPTRQVADTVVAAGLRLASRVGLRLLVVQPVWSVPVLDAALAAHGFGPSPVNVGTVGTIAVPLAGRTDDELLGAMRPALRRNVRRAERAGVTVRRGTHEDLQVFKRMHAETAARNDFRPISPERMEREWEVLHHRGHLQLFVTEHGGSLHSGAVCTSFGDRVLFRHAGWFRSEESGRLRPNDLLHWRIIQWARDHGFGFYDMGGFDRQIAAGLLRGEEPPEEFRSSYSQFKLGYGGTPLVLPCSVWRVLPGALRPLQQPLRWSFEHVPPLERALASRHNA